MRRLRGELEHLVVGEQRAAKLEGNVEPFGYRDGISNPVVQGSGVSVKPGNGVIRADAWDSLAAGEVLLGHIDRNGHPSGHARALSLLRNGSFLAWRKLEQDVSGYNQLIQQVATQLNLTADDAEAKVMGRYKSGKPLAHCFDPLGGSNPGDAATANSFTYLDDPSGARTPRTSHVRRANPRLGIPFGRTLSDAHRIVRRGMPYSDADGSVGLIFQCYQADIARQFEFIQCRWLNDGDSFGLGYEPDPVAGSRPAAPEAGCPWSEAHVLRPGLRAEPIEAKRVVHTRGGAYFFVPGIAALTNLLGDPHR